MMNFRLTFLMIILLFALVSMGCRPRPVVPSLPTVTPTPTTAPTPTPAPSPTAAPTLSPAQPLAPGTGPFTGTFEGSLNGDNESSAPVTLTLAQDGSVVSGTITVGEGLFLDGGNCGATAVPAGTKSASGEVDTTTPNHLDASATFTAQGFTIALDLDADLSADGQTLTAEATIDLPFLCGRNPVITGAFTRV
jgi:hypothetical protein